MRNEVVCAVQECKPPCDGCVPIPTDNDQCCPERYECGKFRGRLFKILASKCDSSSSFRSAAAPTRSVPSTNVRFGNSTATFRPTPTPEHDHGQKSTIIPVSTSSEATVNDSPVTTEIIGLPSVTTTNEPIVKTSVFSAEIVSSSSKEETTVSSQSSFDSSSSSSENLPTTTSVNSEVSSSQSNQPTTVAEVREEITTLATDSSTSSLPSSHLPKTESIELTEHSTLAAILSSSTLAPTVSETERVSTSSAQPTTTTVKATSLLREDASTSSSQDAVISESATTLDSLSISSSGLEKKESSSTQSSTSSVTDELVSVTTHAAVNLIEDSSASSTSLPQEVHLQPEELRSTLSPSTTHAPSTSTSAFSDTTAEGILNTAYYACSLSFNYHLH